MMTLPSPDDCERFMRWLRLGASMALDTHGCRATHRDTIWCLLENAIEVIEKLPDTEKRWLSSGTRSGGWGQVGDSAWEALLIERSRMMAAMLPCEDKAVAKPGYDDEERAIDVLSWLQWCRSERDFHGLQKGIASLARGDGNADVARVYKPGRAASRQTIHEIRTRAFACITRGLRTDCHIVPALIAPSFEVRPGLE